MGISVDVKGASDALEMLINYIDPWRRQYIERKLKLDSAYRQSEIQKLNAETQNTIAQTEKERASTLADKNQAELVLAQAKKLEAEAALIKAQADKVLVELKNERIKLKLSQLDLALKIVDKYAPNMDDDKKITFAIRVILPELERLMAVDVEVILPEP